MKGRVLLPDFKSHRTAFERFGPSPGWSDCRGTARLHMLS